MSSAQHGSLRLALVIVSLLAACEEEDREVLYVGRATSVIALARADVQRPTTNPDEETRVRRVEGGRLRIAFNLCTITTNPASDGRATIPAGARCGARRPEISAEIVVRSGDVRLADDDRTLSMHLVGDGRLVGNDRQVDVLFEYTFRGRRRKQQQPQQ